MWLGNSSVFLGFLMYLRSALGSVGSFAWLGSLISETRLQQLSWLSSVNMTETESLETTHTCIYAWDWHMFSWSLTISQSKSQRQLQLKCWKIDGLGYKIILQRVQVYEGKKNCGHFCNHLLQRQNSNPVWTNIRVLLTMQNSLQYKFKFAYP